MLFMGVSFVVISLNTSSSLPPSLLQETVTGTPIYLIKTLRAVRKDRKNIVFFLLVFYTVRQGRRSIVYFCFFYFSPTLSYVG